jgi:prevent-host-death family protein
MEYVGSYEAKTHLPRLLKRVKKGEHITITRHGVPVAVLQPPDASRCVETKKVVADIRAFRKKLTLDGLSLRDMVEESRR